MSIKKQKMSWSFKDLIGPLLQAKMDYKWFGVRKNNVDPIVNTVKRQNLD